MQNRIQTCLFLVVSCLVGCERSADIKHYTVPHESGTSSTNSTSAPSTAMAASAAATPQRMLAAIVPVGPQVWFFKAMGTPDEVEKNISSFQSLLDSLKLDPQGTPAWTLPEGWSQQPGNQFRYATLVASEGLEVSVSSLPAPGGEASEQYILDNINRWRNQLQLPPIGSDDLGSSVQKFEFLGTTAYRVDLVGQGSTQGPPMAGPFQGGAAGSAERPAAATSDSGKDTAATNSGGLQFTKPENWQTGRSSSIRLASFLIEDNGRTAEVTVIALGPSAGSLLDNVNRWRGQVNLAPISDADLQATVQTVDVDGIPSQYVQILDPDQGAKDAILAVVVPRSDQTLFIKLMGPNELVSAEAKAFEEFVRSIRFAGQ